MGDPTNFLLQFTSEQSYLSIFLLMLLFPSESTMPVAGYLAATGSLNLPIAITVGVVGTTLGSVVIYMFGRLASLPTIVRFIHHGGRFVGLTERRIERAGRRFDRHARLAVFAGRFLPALRSAVSLIAGFRGLPLPQFIWYTALGSLVDGTLLALLGYAFHDNYQAVIAIATWIASAVSVAVILLLVIRGIRRNKKPRTYSRR